MKCKKTVLLSLFAVAACQTPVQHDETLRQELLGMEVTDQEIRGFAAEHFASGDPLPEEVGRRWHEVDTANTARLGQIIERHGWPGKSLVGEDGAAAAFLLVQHADLEPEFQKRSLVLLEQAVKDGEAKPAHLAYLTDRVRRHQDQAQVYGTQCQWIDGEPVPFTIEDPEHVDERRAAVGLGPLSEYLELMKSGN